jgi:SAM-dependent methyltransferase
MHRCAIILDSELTSIHPDAAEPADQVLWRRVVTESLKSLSRAVARFARSARRSADQSTDSDSLTFRCNICSGTSTASLSRLGREDQSCKVCQSTVRMRGIVRVLSVALFGSSLAVSDFPVRRELVGLGLSDWVGYAERLGRKFSYTNTFYDAEPRMDITCVEPRYAESADFVIASDVFEHVAQPVEAAFAGAFRILKPGGALVFSVPYVIEPDASTVEHFPELHTFELIARRDGTRALVNVTADGRRQEFEDLVFHGGGGLTLEMRVFSERDLLEHLERAGFVDVTIHAEPDLAHGIVWRDAWSLPISARKP